MISQARGSCSFAMICEASVCSKILGYKKFLVPVALAILEAHMLSLFSSTQLPSIVKLP